MTKSIEVGATVRRVKSHHAEGLKVGQHGVVDDVRYDGRIHIKGEPPEVVHSPVNLVLADEPAEASPVRVVTRQEIVPGTYGQVEVAGAGATIVQVRLKCLGFSAAELRAAARVFNSLAEALEGQG